MLCATLGVSNSTNTIQTVAKYSSVFPFILIKGRSKQILLDLAISWMKKLANTKIDYFEGTHFLAY